MQYPEIVSVESVRVYVGTNITARLEYYGYGGFVRVSSAANAKRSGT